jgi:riboflavin kinase / FMN adenylyltransferase
MEIFRDIEDPQLKLSGSVVTMGNFDGIHLGHQALLRHTVEDAKQRGLPAIVLTFEPHPLKLLAPERAPRLLIAPEDKMELLEDFGIDTVIAQTFDRQFSSLSAEDFVSRCILGRLKTRKIWVGRDLRFGRERQGSVDNLVHWGAAYGFEVGIVEPILLNGVRISSSQIRRFIEQGRVHEVKPLLGRYHFIGGRVVAGRKRGRDLGFPTANICSRTEAIPLDGIYATIIEIRTKPWLSVSSIGVNPTFADGTRTVETFVLDFEHDLYGEPVKLSFIERIREERKFPTAEALVAEMENDVSSARAIFDKLGLAATIARQW